MAHTKMVSHFKVGNRRQLPPLLFLTNSEALASQIGVDGRDIAMQAVYDAATAVVDTRSRNMLEIADEVSVRLRQRPACKGVVIVGGHDVIPHGVTDVVIGTPYEEYIDKPLMETDVFVVWNDDVYGYRGTGEAVGEVVLPDVAVSRIPDARSDALLLTALEACGSDHKQEFAGIRRSVTSEYAAKVHQATFGTWTDWLIGWFRPSPVVTSEPVSSELPANVEAGALYLALHGEKCDAALYGETKKTLHRVEAITPACLPKVGVPNVTFAAACWSGLVVNTTADMAFDDAAIQQKTVDESIALTLLSRGARAVIGCTSVHHSPPLGMTTLAAAPFHIAFWKSYRAGIPPAEALLEAKRTYAANLPYRRDDKFEQALELKTIAEFCCLGLGW
ncbi:MAG TPA: hypothetical protein VNG73_00460 [Gemmatimonadaceae bacterium]|nr:hypothetical protein [Gemmatimonadaceae bacterium]